MDTASIEEEIKKIEEEILSTQKNKATEHHIGKLKAKIARLRAELEKQRSAGGKGKGFSIKKSGDATVALVGFPSVGKSTLLNQLTDAYSEVGHYEFTTIEVIPGMMNYKGAKIQLLDLPGLISGASMGKGRGREILSALRNADLLLLIVEAARIKDFDIMIKELYDAGIRLNTHKPDVIIRKTGQGGLIINAPSTLNLDIKTIKSIASEYVTNAEITIREDITEDQLIDVFMDNRKYISALVVVNKIDQYSKAEIDEAVSKIRNWKIIPVSAKTGIGLDELKEEIFDTLGLIRIYMKPQGKKPDFNEPLILRRGGTVEDVCSRLHRDFKERFRYAQVWGRSVKYQGQKVGLEHELEDEDILTIILHH
ncbi:MAG: GTP-binding protein [Thermoplasmata archaeon]|nr:MAG: GTP-binding protein [Thermoplasmata archaeon]